MANTFQRAILASLTFSSVIFWLYCAVILQKNGHKAYFTKRGLILTKSYLWMSGCIVIIIVPLLNLFYIFIQPPCEQNDAYIGRYNQTYSNTEIIVYVSTRYFLSFSIILGRGTTQTILSSRIVLQFMNIRRVEDSFSWKTKINPNYQKTSFVSKYFHILGNPKRLFIICLLISLIEIVACLVIIFITFKKINFDYDLIDKTSIYDEIWYTLMAIFTVSWCIKTGIAMYCIVKLWYFIDYWHIRSEVKYIFISMTMLITLMVLDVFISYIIDGYESGIYGIISIFWIVLSWYLTVVWVYKINEKKIHHQNQSDNCDVNESLSKRIFNGKYFICNNYD